MFVVLFPLQAWWQGEKCDGFQARGRHSQGSGGGAGHSDCGRQSWQGHTSQNTDGLSQRLPGAPLPHSSLCVQTSQTQPPPWQPPVDSSTASCTSSCWPLPWELFHQRPCTRNQTQINNITSSLLSHFYCNTSNVTRLYPCLCFYCFVSEEIKLNTDCFVIVFNIVFIYIHKQHVVCTDMMGAQWKIDGLSCIDI